MDKVNDRRIVHLLAQGEPSERTREFLQAFESPVPEVLLIEGTRLVHGRIGEGVPLDPNGLVVPVRCEGRPGRVELPQDVCAHVYQQTTN